MYIHIYLRLRGHIDSRPRADGVLAPPQTRHRLELRVKVQARFPVECVCSTSRDRLFVAREAEHGQRYGNGYIDSNLSGLDFFLEFSGGGARSGEDGRSVSVLILIDEFDGVVESGDVETDENRAEDFFLVAGHVFGDVGDDGWSDLKCVSQATT